MRTGKFNVVTDAQWGSCGKGAITTYLAWRYRPQFLSTTNMANAGHTAVDRDGRTFIAKALPSAAILNRWYPEYNPTVCVGPSAAFNLEQLFKEADECDLTPEAPDLATGRLLIHPRAGVITQEHRERESGAGEGSTKHIASTMQGCGTFLADKVLRKPGLRLARDYPALKQFLVEPQYQEGPYADTTGSMPITLMRQLSMGQTILHEGSQGFSLDIHHGSEYPSCTSRQTTAVQNLADMGLSVKHMGAVYLVMRPYPIRVGNVVEEGKTVGHSGGGYPGQREITWEQVAQEGGLPPEEATALLKKELTTVTRRLRRVFTFSKQQVREAAAINGATRIALNFANYIDWSCSGTNDPGRLTTRVFDFIRMVEDATGVPVTLVGTGPAINHVVDLENPAM